MGLKEWWKKINEDTYEKVMNDRHEPRQPGCYIVETNRPRETASTFEQYGDRIYSYMHNYRQYMKGMLWKVLRERKTPTYSEVKDQLQRYIDASQGVWHFHNVVPQEFRNVETQRSVHRVQDEELNKLMLLFFDEMPRPDDPDFEGKTKALLAKHDVELLKPQLTRQEHNYSSTERGSKMWKDVP